MGQTRSDLSRSSAAPCGAKGKAGETAQRLRIRRFRRRHKREARGQLNGNSMKSKVLSCLGRRKRDSGQTEASLRGVTGAGGPETRRDHRVGKLPRDELALATGEPRAHAGCFETPSGLEVHGETVRVVNRAATPGSLDASGFASGTGEVGGAGCEEPKPEREDDAANPPTTAMDQPVGGHGQSRVVSDVSVLSPSKQSSAPRDAERTLYSLYPVQPLDGGHLITDERVAAGKMTKSDCGPASCPTTATEAQSRKDCDRGSQSHPGGQSFPGTIPKLIVTRDPSPSRSQGTPVTLTVRTELCTGSCLEPHTDDESPCSDSGCGGSPALTRSPRKLSNSSSIGLSSASSFEESEDDFTGSDIESSLSPARSLCSPDDGTGVSVSINI